MSVQHPSRRLSLLEVTTVASRLGMSCRYVGHAKTGSSHTLNCRGPQHLKCILLLVSIISCCTVRRNLCLCKFGDASPPVRHHLNLRILNLRERSISIVPPSPLSVRFLPESPRSTLEKSRDRTCDHSHGVLSDIQSCIHRLPRKSHAMGQPIISSQRFTFCARVPWALHMYHTTFHLVSDIVLHDWLVPGGDFA